MHTHPKSRSVTMRRLAAAAFALALGAASPLAALAQQDAAAPAAPEAAATVPAPAGVESQPLAPLTGTQAQAEQPSGAAQPTQPETPAAPGPQTAPAAPAPATPAPAAPAPAPSTPAAPAGDLTTLAPAPSDTSMPDEVEVAPRPVASLRASSSWDEGYDTLTRTFRRLAEEMQKAGIKVTGKPISTFLETDDNGFRFEAQLPIAAAPAERPAGLSPDVTFGQAPSGKFIRFVHRGPYDDIDSTYEAVSAYLDSKGIEVKDMFTEEYVNQGTSAGDPDLELFIYVQPKS